MNANPLENILDVVIIDQYISETVNGLTQIAEKSGINAIEKIVEIIFYSSSFRDNRKSLMQYLHEEKNAHLHLKFERQIPQKTVEPLSKIIKQGVKEGIFNTKYPEDAAKAFIGISALVLQGFDSVDRTSEEFLKKFMAVIDFYERIFGTKSGSILNAYKKKLQIMEGN